MKLNKQILTGLCEAVEAQSHSLELFNKNIAPLLDELDEFIEGDYDKLKKLFKLSNEQCDELALIFNAYIKSKIRNSEQAAMTIQFLYKIFECKDFNDFKKKFKTVLEK